MCSVYNPQFDPFIMNKKVYKVTYLTLKGISERVTMGGRNLRIYVSFQDRTLLLISISLLSYLRMVSTNGIYEWCNYQVYYQVC